MPIYEFRCLKCNELFEILFTTALDKKEMKCSHCGSKNVERVLSSTNYSMGGPAPSSKSGGASSTTKTCGTGSCTTLEIPSRYE